jgi:transcription elongation GreA/GreB family factor
VSGLVDPSPMIEQELEALDAEYIPKLVALERALAEADADGQRSAKADLRAMKREYAAARRQVDKLRTAIAHW